MKAIYYDANEQKDCVSILSASAQIMPAGATVYAMPVSEKNDVYRRYAEEYDIHFIFDDEIPVIDFYTVPQADIMAVDSSGGYIATIGQLSDLESDAPICYIKNRECLLIAGNGAEFLAHTGDWKSNMKPYQGLSFYSSAEEAKKQVEFVELAQYKIR